jgi:hypothetical protein
MTVDLVTIIFPCMGNSIRDDMLWGSRGTIARNESDQVRYQPQGRNKLRGVDTISAVPPMGGQESGYNEATN